MAGSRGDIRQLNHKNVLDDQLTTVTGEQLDNLISSLNSEATPPLRITTDGSRTITIGNIFVTNPITGKVRTIPPISNLLPSFTSGTIVFPSANNNNATVSPGTNFLVNITASRFLKVGFSLDANGNLTLTQGTEGVTASAATAPPSIDGLFPIGYVILENIAGTIQVIPNTRIAQYLGGGGSGGSGSGNELLEALRNMLDDSMYDLVTPNIFKTEQQTMIASFGASGTFSVVENAVSLPVIGDSVTSTQQLDAGKFLTQSKDITNATLAAFWKSTAIDTAATYQLSRDGGSHYQTVTMSRIGNNGVGYVGEYNWTREEEDASSDTLSFATTSTTTEFTNVAGIREALGQRFVLTASSTHITNLGVYLSKVGSPTGTYTIKLVGDNGANVPQELTLYYQSANQSVSGLTGSAVLYNFACDLDLAAGTYHILALTDGDYKNIYVAGTTVMRMHGGTASPTGDFFNDSVWAGEATVEYAFTVTGKVESFASVATYAVGSATSSVSLNATTEQQLAQAYVLATDQVVKRLTLYFNRATSASVGNFYAQIVKDNAGVPSLLAADVLAESSAVSIAGLGTGNIAVQVAMPKTALAAGTYHIVLRTDAAYKAGTMNLAWRDDATPPAAPLGTRYNGTAYSGLSAAGRFVYIVEGRALDLRVKVTSGTTASILQGYGIFYSKQTTGVNSGLKNVQSFSFLSNTNNTSSFTLNWTPDPDLLKCYRVETGAVFLYPAFSINGNVVTFPANTFLQVSDQTVTLKFMQTEGAVFDNSSQNAGNIASLTTAQTAMGNATVDQVVVNYLTAVNGTPGAGQFRSEITGRTKMVDLTTDLLPRMGIMRIPVQQIMQLGSETGPNGELVYKPVNDKYDQIRFYGSWSNIINFHGAYINTVAAVGVNLFIEVTFVGTGLNMLALSTTQEAFVTVDGGSEGANIMPTVSTILQSRNYAPNVVYPITSGLTLGLHTVKIRSTGTVGIYPQGFEIINDGVRTTGNITSGSASMSSVAITAGVAVGNTIVATGVPAGTTILSISSSTITMSANATATTTGVAVQFTGSVIVNPGVSYAKGKGLTLASQTGFQYNTGFESGVLGTRGGRVVVYQKSDWTIAKAVTPVNTASATLSSADHTNEEVIRNYFWREFGAGRTDDFSTVVPGGDDNNAYTLDDGITTLVCRACATSVVQEAIASNSGTPSNSFFTLTFVGTGLDITRIDSATGTEVFNAYIDGGSALALNSSGSTSLRIEKIVSGLPYGTHTVRIARDNPVAYQIGVRNFIVYGPKKPTLPTGAFELADYNVMANFVANSTIGNNFVSTGVVRKHNTREFVYSGTWAIGIDPADISGWNTSTSTTGDFVEYAFFGTSIVWRGYCGGAAQNFTISIDGSADLSAYTRTLSTGLTISTPSTGVVTGTPSVNYGNVVSISDIPLGLHKVRITRNAGQSGAFFIGALEVGSQIHVHKNLGPFVLNNTLAVGSQSISDNRASQLNYTKGKHSRMHPLAQGSTLSTTEAPMAIQVPIYLDKDELVSCSFQIPTYPNAAGQNSSITMRVDGVLVEKTNGPQTSAGNKENMFFERVVPMTKGWHLLYFGWFTSGTQLNMANISGGFSNDYGNITMRIVGS